MNTAGSDGIISTESAWNGDVKVPAVLVPTAPFVRSAEALDSGVDRCSPRDRK